MNRENRSNNSSADLKYGFQNRNSNFQFGTPSSQSKNMLLMETTKHKRSGINHDSLLNTKENFHKLMASGQIRVESHEGIQNSASSIETAQKANSVWD